MKKLSKIKLQNAVVLENQEMKMIFGGSGYGNICDKRTSCKTTSDCSGSQICISSENKKCCF